MHLLLAEADTVARITDPAGVLAVLLAVLAVVLHLQTRPVVGRIFKVIPALLFCYFIPTTLTTLNVIPAESEVYTWIKTVVLPASLLLLILALDVPGILRLGPKAIIMLLAGTLGVVIGGPIAMLICGSWLPDDAWRGMAALSGSWIGGGANMIALKEIAETSDDMFQVMIIVDVFVANLWMAVLLYSAGIHQAIDRFTGANADIINDLERRISDYQAKTARIATLPDLMVILAIGFVGSWLARIGGTELATWWATTLPEYKDMLPSAAWKFILITTAGVILSFTPVRRLDGAGASRIGSVMIYLLVASIGASASFSGISEHWIFIVMGLIWMAVHVIVLLTVARIIRAPIFFVAVGSQANIGGAASAPVVASAFHPSLAAVGALLAVAGYVLGTYAASLCMHLMKWVSGV